VFKRSKSKKASIPRKDLKLTLFLSLSLSLQPLLKEIAKAHQNTRTKNHQNHKKITFIIVWTNLKLLTTKKGATALA
jgi:hypothetical protein